MKSPAKSSFDCVFGHHANPHGCGVAKFNQMLAGQLGVPFFPVFSERRLGFRKPLVSLKVSEMDSAESMMLEGLLRQGGLGEFYGLFIHELSGTDLEEKLVIGAERVFCGNAEIVTRIAALRPDAVELWCPGMVYPSDAPRKSELSIFTFGMAHKFNAVHYHRLHELLLDSGLQFSINFSCAIHEGGDYDGDFKLMSDYVNREFPGHGRFLGHLSDDMVIEQLRSCTYFAAFFERGVRANNTTINAAMEYGAVVITNTDQYSPGQYVHGENFIDVDKCQTLPTDSRELDALSRNARASSDDYSWDRLISALQEG